MSLLSAVVRAGLIPPDTAEQDVKKRYSELLSHHLAVEVADGLRHVGFSSVKPVRTIVEKGKHKG
ncbi:MAG: hypothetical protein ACRD1S_14630, partial [Vicinamibacterales bacterium]